MPNAHEAKPVDWSWNKLAHERVMDAFGMRHWVYTRVFGYIFDNRISGVEGKHRAEH